MSTSEPRRIVHPSVEEAVRVVEANRHWIYKQCSEELEHAIRELLNFTKWKLDLP